MEEEGGVVRTHEMVDKGYIYTENSQMMSTDANISPTYQTKQLNNGRTHQSCGEL